MRGYSRFIYRRLLPVRLRRQVDLFYSLRPGMHNPELVDLPPGNRVLVLAPHPDDEVIACGGTLYKHHLAGNSITVLYMTDGRKGGDETLTEEECVRIRREEARQAGKIIGIHHQIFMENRDMELKENRETVSQLREAVSQVNPDIVYLPFFLDNHPDHQATNNIFIAAFNGHKRELMCYAYEIWTPFIPNCIVDITLYSDVKMESLKRFQSQVRRFNAVGANLGLMKYRSVMHLGKDGYAECFFRSDFREYARLWKLVNR